MVVVLDWFYYTTSYIQGPSSNPATLGTSHSGLVRGWLEGGLVSGVELYQRRLDTVDLCHNKACTLVHFKVSLMQRCPHFRD